MGCLYRKNLEYCGGSEHGIAVSRNNRQTRGIELILKRPIRLSLTILATVATSCFWLRDATAGDASADTTAAPKVVSILEQMESTGQAIQSIRCKVVYRVEDRLNLTETQRFGTILFKRSQPHDMFLIEFSKLIADGIKYSDKQWWLFRDRWLTECKSKSRTIIRRETVRPGETVDLFDLEKAPFPVPFGQRKEQILRNFDVRIVEPQLDDPDGCDHLVCRPKPGTPLSEDYKRLDFYVSREMHLPVRIVAEDMRGDQITRADFPDLTKASWNVKLDDDAFELPADEVKGFAVVKEPLSP